jgi:type IV pilus assembly protein PilW
MTKIKQQGITLVSLMVATVIGIFLVGGVLTIYMNSKTSFNVRNVVAEAAENQRFALDDMRRIVVMVGRSIVLAEELNPSYSSFPPVTTNTSAAAASGAEFIYDGGTTDSDIIAVRYRRGPSCVAYQNVADTVRPSMVRYLVVNNDLVCELTTYTGGTTTTRQTLVSGIQRMKVLYGVDDTNSGYGYATRYLTAPQVNALTTPPGGATPWSRVVSMRIGLIVSSETELPPKARRQSAETLSLLGMSFTEPNTSQLYRVAVGTVQMRNFNPTIRKQ